MSREDRILLALLGAAFAFILLFVTFCERIPVD